MSADISQRISGRPTALVSDGGRSLTTISRDVRWQRRPHKSRLRHSDSSKPVRRGTIAAEAARRVALRTLAEYAPGEGEFRR
jgi:hypothetical protein